MWKTSITNEGAKEGAGISKNQKGQDAKVTLLRYQVEWNKPLVAIIRLLATFGGVWVELLYDGFIILKKNCTLQW